MDISKLLKRDRESDEIWVNEFNEESAQDFRDDVMEEAKDNPMKPIVVYIDSYGGAVDALAKMIETMDELPNPFVTVAMGKAMSCGAVLLSHGDLRFCGKHSRVMIHEVSGATGGDVHDMAADAQEIKRLNKHFMGLLAKNCGIKGGYDALRKLIKDKDGRDNYMNAEQALKFNIIDSIGLPKIDEVSAHQISLVPDKTRMGKTKSAGKTAKKSESKKSRRRT